MEGERRYHFSFRGITLSVVIIGYGILCFLFFGLGFLLGYDTGASKPDVVALPSLPALDSSVSAPSAISESVVETPAVLQDSPPPDSLRRVVNYAENKTSVMKDSTIVVELSVLRSMWEIQLAAFNSRSRAETYQRELRKKGLICSVLEVNNISARVLYVVRIGRFSSRAAASRSASELATAYSVQVLVQPYGKLQ